MAESSVEYGLPPRDELEQRKVKKLFGRTWAKLYRVPGNGPRDREIIGKEIQRLMDRLAFLNIELPCQGVEFQGVIVNRDSEIPQDTLPAPFVEWGKALGVSSDLFENKKGSEI